MGTPRTINGLFYDGDDSNITRIRYKRRKTMFATTSFGYELNNDGCMHPVYGDVKYYPSSTPRSPFRLVLPKPDGSGVYTQEEAYAELMKPIWGLDHDQVFDALLPIVPPPPSSTTWISNFKPIDPAVTPSNDSLYIMRRVVSEIPKRYAYSNAVPSFIIPYGLDLGYIEYKKAGESDGYQGANPDYQSLNTTREQKLLEYENILKATFKLFGLYLFPALRTNELIIPTLIADTETQKLYWDKTHTKIPDPTWVMPTQEELAAAKLNGVNLPTIAPLISSWTEANRWTADTIPAEFLFSWEILQNGVWKKIPVMNDYWLAKKELSGYVQKMLEIPDNAERSNWDGFVEVTCELVPPKATSSQRIKRLLGL